MTQDDIICMAREAGFKTDSEGLLFIDDGDGVCHQELEHIVQAAYAAGQADEREACADLCYQLVDNSRETRFATAIRARGQ